MAFVHPRCDLRETRHRQVLVAEGIERPTESPRAILILLDRLALAGAVFSY
jgi:hypothetical protein